MPQRDITPTLELITGLRSQDWDAKGALSEFVDNSLGEGRGNASRVDITWSPSIREVRVLDNGQAMVDVADLFQLGKGAGRSPKDIGKYGMGGTMALVWLGDAVHVWTKKNGSVQSAHVVWSELRSWNIDQGNWTRASLANTPSELLAEAHGTLIAVTVPRSRRFVPDVIQQELARRYAPGLRQGRRIRWTTRGSRGQERVVDLTPPLGLPNPNSINFAIPLGGVDLWVEGSIGFDATLGPKESRVAIGFGPRIVKTTTDCYRDFSGLGVAGWIDLGEGWQDYLTTAKTDFTDAELYDALMAVLFEKLEPLLQQTARDREFLQLENIALQLSVSLEGAFNVDVEAAPRDPASQYHWHVTGRGKDVPPIESRREPVAGSGPGEGTTRKEKAGTKIWIDYGSAEQLKGALWSVEAKENAIRVCLDADAEPVRLARKQKSPMADMLLAGLVIPAVAAAVLEFPFSRQQDVLRENLFKQLEGQDQPSDKLALLIGHFMANTHVGAVA